jgi:FkbM family methyltransferase
MGALELFLREGGEVVYDIGANIGLYTRFAIDRFGASKVVAFEPMSSNRNQLLKNVGLSDFEDRVTVLPFALSNEDGYAKLQVDDVQGQTAALDQVTGGSPAEGRLSMGLSPKTESVETRLLDSVVYEDGLPKPDVIKIDVEGAEKMVLDGATKTIKYSSPDIILENHGKVEAKETVSFLLKEGYKLSGKMSERFKKKAGNSIGHNDICKIKNKYDARFIVASKRNINISMI